MLHNLCKNCKKGKKKKKGMSRFILSVSLANSPKSDNLYFEWDKMQTNFQLEYQNVLKGIDSLKLLNVC